MAGDDRITLRFGADIDEVTRGADRMADGLDDVDEKLDDLGKTGEEAGKTTAEGLEDADRGLSDMGDSADDTSGRLDALGDIGKQALEGDVGEAAISATSLLSAFGGAGVLAGTIAAGGISLVTSALEEQEKKAEEVRQRLVGMYKDAAEQGRAFIDQAAVDASVLELLFGTKEERQTLMDEAAQIGVDFQTYVRAQAGDYESLQFAIEQAEEAERKRQALFGGGGGNAEGAVYDDTLAKIQEVKTELQGIAGEHELNQQAAQDYLDFQDQSATEQREQIQRTSDADQARYEAAAANIAKLKGEKVVVPVTVNTTQATKDLEAWRKRFTTGDGARLTIVADVVDRNGKPVK